jgi:hypothetical protein
MTATTARVSNSSTVNDLRALGGLITADKVRAVAGLSVDPRAIDLRGAGTFTNLRIAGRTVPENVAPNTRINLPNIGNVIVKKIVKSGGGGADYGGVRVEMLHVNVLQANSLGLPVGSVVSLGSASAAFERGPLDVSFAGEAFGTAMVAKSTSTLRTRVARTARVFVDCQGTDGETLKSEVANSSVPGVISTGRITNGAITGPVLGDTRVTVISNVENVSLFGGLVRANSIRAVARDTVEDGVRISSAVDSAVTGLSIAGIPVPPPAPNTQLPLAGIGHVILNEQSVQPANSRNRTAVTGIHIVVETPNSFGVPVGTEILVGRAESLAIPVEVGSRPGS